MFQIGHCNPYDPPRHEQALPGSIEAAALDAMLSGSSLLVMALGAGSLVTCLRNRAKTAKMQLRSVMDLQATKGGDQKGAGGDLWAEVEAEAEAEQADAKKRVALGMDVDQRAAKTGTSGKVGQGRKPKAITISPITPTPGPREKQVGARPSRAR